MIDLSSKPEDDTVMQDKDNMVVTDIPKEAEEFE
jgi:hypothetical protein